MFFNNDDDDNLIQNLNALYKKWKNKIEKNIIYVLLICYSESFESSRL